MIDKCISSGGLEGRRESGAIRYKRERHRGGLDLLKLEFFHRKEYNKAVG